MQVRDAVCLVTGSAQGLGKAFAVRLLAAGAKVCISDVKEEGGLATLKELREKFGEDKVTFVLCDVTKSEQFSKYDKLSISSHLSSSGFLTSVRHTSR